MCIIEFYGTFWHADPRKYKAGDILKRGNSEKYHVTAQEVWQKDYERITELVENTKLPCIIVWENDYRKNKGATIQTVLQKIIKFKNIHLAQNEQRTNSI
jgi:G:T-mismatch repair DNA endonuclease (very short patch repair protein)